MISLQSINFMINKKNQENNNNKNILKKKFLFEIQKNVKKQDITLNDKKKKSKIIKFTEK